VTQAAIARVTPGVLGRLVRIPFTYGLILQVEDGDAHNAQRDTTTAQHSMLLVSTTWLFVSHVAAASCFRCATPMWSRQMWAQGLNQPADREPHGRSLQARLVSSRPGQPLGIRTATN
jgi:hypothetical protein